MAGAMHAYDLMPIHDDNADGWTGGAPRGIPTESWPRSLDTGTPLLHVLSLRLPPEYRRKGEAFVGVALFQDDNLHAPTVQGVQDILEGRRPLAPEKAAQPFWALIARAAQHRHPHAVQMLDHIGGAFVLVWLTEAELTGEETPPPEVVYPPGQETCAYDRREPATAFKLVARTDDPNVGKRPVDHADDSEDGYVPWSDLDDELQGRLADTSRLGHLGGTAVPAQDMPEGLSPWFLELHHDAGAVNFGGGTGQLDLENQTIEWACG